MLFMRAGLLRAFLILLFYHILSGNQERTSPVLLWQNAYAETSSQSVGKNRSIPSLQKPLERLGKGWITAVQYSPDGKYIAVATSIGVELRNPTTLTQTHFLQGHTGPVGAIAFHPDGEILASGGYDKTIILWKVETGEKLTTLQGHQNWVTALSFNKDGTLLASGSYDETVILWDLKVETGSSHSYKTLRGHTGHVLSLAFSPDETLLASGGSDNQIILWGVHCSVRQAHDRQDNVERKQKTPTSQTNSNPRVSSDPCRKNSPLLKILSGYKGAVQSLAFNPDGSLLASGSDDASVVLWDVKKGERIRTISSHQDAVKSVTFNRDGTLLASGSFDGTVLLWNIPSKDRELWAGGDEQTIDCNLPAAHCSPPFLVLRGPIQKIWSISFSPDERSLVSGSSENLLARWDLPDRGNQPGAPVSLAPSQVVAEHTAPLWSSALSPDYTSLALASDNGAIHLWNLTSVGGMREWEDRKMSAHLGAVRTIAFNRDGTLLASGGEDRQIVVWDTQSGVKKWVFEGHSGPVLKVAFSPDDTFLVSGGNDQKLLIWDLSTGEKIKTLIGHNQDVLALAFYPDGKILVSASSDGTILFWDINGGEPVNTLTRPAGWMSSLAMSPDSTLLAFGNLDNSVTLWSITDNLEVKTLQGHTAPVWSMAFSPDGSLLATAGSDSKIFLWTVAEGRLVKTLEGHTSWITSLNFLPAGVHDDTSLLISASADGTALLWEVKGSEIGETEQIATSLLTKQEFTAPKKEESQNLETGPNKDEAIESQSAYQRWYDLGLQRMKEKKWDSAIENLRRALREKKTSSAEEKLKEALYYRWYDLGMERIKQKRWEDAIENFTFALNLLDTKESRMNLRKANHYKWYETGIQQARQKLWAQAAESLSLALGFLDTEETRTRLKEIRYHRWYQTGMEQFNQARWDQALDSFILALQEKDTPEVRVKLKEVRITLHQQDGQIQAQQQNWNQAIKHFTQALDEAESLNSEFRVLMNVIQSDLDYARGSLAMEQQNWQEAVNFFKKTLEVNPNHAEAQGKLAWSSSSLNRQIQNQVQTFLNLGEEKMREWDWQTAKDFFQKAKVLDPTHPKIPDRLKEVESGLQYQTEAQRREIQLLRAQQEQQARMYLEKEERQKDLIRYQFLGIGILGGIAFVLLVLRRTSLESPAMKAAFYKTLGQYSRAAEIYEKMLENNTERLWIYPLLADLYLKMGKQDENAVEIYDRALSLGFIHPETIVSVSRRYLRDLKTSERAFWIFENALVLNPGNFALSQAVLLKAKMLLPENLEHIRLLSLFLRACQNTNTLDAGIAFLQEIIPVAPSLTDLYLELADLFLEKGKLYPARYYLDLAHKFIRRGETRIHSDLEFKLESIYQRLLLENKQDPMARYHLGLLYQSQGKIWKAIQEFRKTRKVPGWQARSQNKLRECLMTQRAVRMLLSLRPSALKVRFYSLIGKQEKVIQSYENLLEKNPQKAWVYPQLSTLYLETALTSSKAFWVHYKTLLLDPDQEGAALFLAEYYLNRRDISPRAIWAYEKALEFQPNNVELLNILLEACLKTQREEDLLNKVCKRLYQLGYRNKTVCKVLSQTCLKHQRIDREAMLIYERVLQWEPHNRVLKDTVNGLKQHNLSVPL